MIKIKHIILLTLCLLAFALESTSNVDVYYHDRAGEVEPSLALFVPVSEDIVTPTDIMAITCGGNWIDFILIGHRENGSQAVYISVGDWPKSCKRM